MSAGTFNFTRGEDYNDAIEQGATWNQTFEYTDDAGNPVDLSAYTAARMQGRLAIDDTATVFDLSMAAGTIVLGGAAGTVQILVDATTTAAFDWDGQVVYDMELVDSLGNVVRFLKGVAELDREVTR